MLATCPGGMMSNLMTHLAKGNLALSVSLTSAISLVYVFTAPLWIGLALELYMETAKDVAPPVLQIIGSLMGLVIVPIAMGMVLRAMAFAFTQRVGGHVRNYAAATILIVYCILVYNQRETMMRDLALLWQPVLFLNLTAVSVSALLAYLFRVGHANGVAVVVEHSLRQEGTAIFIAVTVIGSQRMAMPLILNAAIGFAIGLLIIALARRAVKGPGQCSETVTP